jgi:hypothetical protein
VKPAPDIVPLHEDEEGTQEPWLFVVVIGVFGGFFQFSAGLIEELLDFSRVTAQFALVCLLRFIDLSAAWRIWR